MLVSKLKDCARYIAIAAIVVVLVALTATQTIPVIYYTWTYTVEAIIGIWNWIF